MTHAEVKPLPPTTLSPKDVENLFNIPAKNVSFQVTAFKDRNDFVPQIDPKFVFDPEITKVVLAAFSFNKRMLISGLHGSGKSSYIEQVAARLNWPMVRLNLDNHITRLELVGRDVIEIIDGKQTTAFREGFIPFCLQNNMALVLDEYDAARAETMFIIQRILEENGKFTLLETGKVISPSEYFRVFATSNTVGLGDETGMYSGTQIINQAQMDRWQIVMKIDQLEPEQEKKILHSRFADQIDLVKEKIDRIIQLSLLIRSAFLASEISVIMSLRSCINFLENWLIFQDDKTAFSLAFHNRCSQEDKPLVSEIYCRIFGEEL